MTAQTRLFVGGIPSSANSDTLGDSFSKFGHVVSCELKSKPTDPDNQFAFITLAADQRDVEACIRHFSQSEWKGKHLHVTRARESFLERLEKERQQAQIKKPTDDVPAYKSHNDYDGSFKIKTPQINNLNIRKPGGGQTNGYHNERKEDKVSVKPFPKKTSFNSFSNQNEKAAKERFTDDKKLNSDNKRLESMRKMRQEFNEKKLLIKSGLAGVDKASNKRIKFDDDVVEQPSTAVPVVRNGRVGMTLFQDDSDEDQEDVNFQIKEQFEGKKGQKVLELQSRFKSDKRFTLDERFIEDELKDQDQKMDVEDEVQVLGEGEKARQLSILQNVLGVAIKSAHTQPQDVNDNKKTKAKMGMLRFDPNQPDHAKFLAPKSNVKEEVDSSKKKKNKKKEEPIPEPQPVVEVSKEQFYKVSDTLKEAIAQPNTFSLRSLFAKDEKHDDDGADNIQETGYTSLPSAKKDKVKNPFDKTATNPFKYDSSDSEPEPDEKEDVKEEQDAPTEEGKTKAVWREKLFFTKFDNRFKEGLAFFNTVQSSGNKERRELKSLVKKRLYNRARKDQMFQKKIGGKRKNFGKSRKQQR